MMPDVNNTICWIGLSSIGSVGRATFRKLTQRFGSPAEVLSAPKDELIAHGGLAPETAEEIVSGAWKDAAAAEAERARSAGIDIVTADEEAYPAILRDIADAPLFLYIYGSLRPKDRQAIAIVGTRTPTHYGLTLTHRMAYELAAAGHTIVSGMARGIDTQAHKGALAAESSTIAVLGCGIDIVYPPENRALRDRIARTGAVLTEYPFGTRPEPGFFPARNRIISGLSAGTIIVEAAADSGSLITADYAVKQGRRLFAVPGNAGSPRSRGTNSLIKQGAVLVESARDVLATGSDAAPSAGDRRQDSLPALTEGEASVLRQLSPEPKHIDALLGACGMTAGMLGGFLTALELKGLAVQLPGKYYTASPR